MWATLVHGIVGSPARNLAVLAILALAACGEEGGGTGADGGWQRWNGSERDGGLRAR